MIEIDNFDLVLFFHSFVYPYNPPQGLVLRAKNATVRRQQNLAHALSVQDHQASNRRNKKRREKIGEALS